MRLGVGGDELCQSRELLGACPGALGPENPADLPGLNALIFEGEEGGGNAWIRE